MGSVHRLFIIVLVVFGMGSLSCSFFKFIFLVPIMQVAELFSPVNFLWFNIIIVIFESTLLKGAYGSLNSHSLQVADIRWVVSLCQLVAGFSGRILCFTVTFEPRSNYIVITRLSNLDFYLLLMHLLNRTWCSSLLQNIRHLQFQELEEFREMFSSDDSFCSHSLVLAFTYLESSHI